MEMVVKIACKKGGAVYFCIVLPITKYMQAEIKWDEKLLIDLEWPYVTCTIHIWAKSLTYHASSLNK